MSANIQLINAGAGTFKLNFSGSTSTLIDKFYFDVSENTLKAYSITTVPALPVLMTISRTGVVQIKGSKVVNAALTNKFILKSNGNLEAPAFMTTV